MVVAAADPLILKPELEFGKLRILFDGFDRIFDRGDVDAV
jgi:hypothetical protein